MRSFLERISSRKFLSALAVQAAGVAALFWPASEQTIYTAAVRIAALAAMLLAALGYGGIEAAVDRAAVGDGEDAAPADTTGQRKVY